MFKASYAYACYALYCNLLLRFRTENTIFGAEGKIQRQIPNFPAQHRQLKDIFWFSRTIGLSMKFQV